LTVYQPNAQFKKYKFLVEKSPEKLISHRHTACNLTHLQDRRTKVKFMLKILAKIELGSETGSGSETI
jgi:hypothetical protein